MLSPSGSVLSSSGSHEGEEGALGAQAGPLFPRSPSGECQLQVLWGSGCFGVHGCLGSSEGLRVPLVGAAFGDPASLARGTPCTLPLLENMPLGLPGSSEFDRLTTTGSKEDKFAGQGQT